MIYNFEIIDPTNPSHWCAVIIRTDWVSPRSLHSLSHEVHRKEEIIVIAFFNYIGNRKMKSLVNVVEKTFLSICTNLVMWYLILRWWRPLQPLVCARTQYLPLSWEDTDLGSGFVRYYGFHPHCHVSVTVYMIEQFALILPFRHLYSLSLMFIQWTLPLLVFLVYCHLS